MLIIIRGLPGSGKSTYARKYYPSTLIVEADMLSMHDGHYCFDPKKLRERHDMTKHIVECALSLGADAVVTGTLTTREEVNPYLELARLNGQQFTIISMASSFKTIHEVPDSVIIRMKSRWEPVHGEIIVEDKEGKA